MEVRCQYYATAALNLGKDAGIHWIGGFVSPVQVWKFVEENNCSLLLEFEPGPSSL